MQTHDFCFVLFCGQLMQPADGHLAADEELKQISSRRRLVLELDRDSSSCFPCTPPRLAVRKNCRYFRTSSRRKYCISRIESNVPWTSWLLTTLEKKELSTEGIADRFSSAQALLCRKSFAGSIWKIRKEIKSRSPGRVDERGFNLPVQVLSLPN